MLFYSSYVFKNYNVKDIVNFFEIYNNVFCYR